MRKPLGGKILRKGIGFQTGDVWEPLKGRSLVDADVILEFRREAGTAGNIYEAPSVQVAFEIESGYGYLGPEHGQIREQVWGPYPGALQYLEVGKMGVNPHRFHFLISSDLVILLCFVMCMVSVWVLSFPASVSSTSRLIIKMSHPYIYIGICCLLSIYD